jgi:NAD(P)H dehydrogenase (quinone)
MPPNHLQPGRSGGLGGFTSFTRAAEPGNPNRHIADYAATEKILADCGLPFTALRFNLWPETLTQIAVAPRAVATGALPSNAGDGRVGHITRDDSAAVAAAVLADGGNQGQLLEVTGPEAVTDADIAAALTEATGRPVRYEPVNDQQIAQALIAHGIPEPFAQPWSTDGIAKRDGWFDITTHAVQRLTGRPATSITEFFIAHRAQLIAAS